MKKVMVIATLFTAVGLTACGGKSEEVSALEAALSSASSDIKACESKKALELSNCVASRLESLNTEWAKKIPTASQDDPEAVEALVEQYTQLTQQASEIMTKAFE